MKKKLLTVLIIFLIIILSFGYYKLYNIESKLPENILDDINIEEKIFMKRNVFTITHKNGLSQNIILYFHGGAYMAEMTENHWNFLQRIAKDSGNSIIILDYPLTPQYTYKDVLNISEAFYNNVISEYNNKNMILMGDSAGGGLALGLLEYMSSMKIKLPNKTILISPWLDTTLSNPQINEVQKNDKDLNKFKLKLASIMYTRGITNEEKFFVNPIEGSLEGLSNITIYTGTYDILNPDCHLLKEKIGDDKINIKEYNKASHIWIINNQDELSENAYKDLLMDLTNL